MKRVVVIGTVIHIECFSDLKRFLREIDFVASFLNNLNKAVENVGYVCGEHFLIKFTMIKTFSDQKLDWTVIQNLH